MFIWRSNSGRIGLATATELREHFIDFLYKRRKKSFVNHRTRPSFSGHISQPLRPSAGDTVSDAEAAAHDDSHLKRDKPPSVDTANFRSYQRRTGAEQLISEYQRVIADQPKMWRSWITYNISHIIRSSQTGKSGCMLEKLPDDEKRQACSLLMNRGLMLRLLTEYPNPRRLCRQIILDHASYTNASRTALRRLGLFRRAVKP